MRTFLSYTFILLSYMGYAQVDSIYLRWKPDVRKFAYETADGQLAVPSYFIWAQPFSEEGYAIARNCEGVVTCPFIIIDKTGATVYELRPNYLLVANQTRVSNGLFPVSDYNAASRFGFMNLKGELKVAPVFNQAASFSEGVACVEYRPLVVPRDTIYNLIYGRTRHVMFVEKTGKPILRLSDEYTMRDSRLAAENIFEFREGLCPVYNINTKKYGYINRKGELVIPCVYDVVGGFSEGVSYAAILKTNEEGLVQNSIGYINKVGEWALLLPDEIANLSPYCFFRGDQFSGGLAEMYTIATESEANCKASGFLRISISGKIFEKSIHQ
jgi:hypothetical protein